MTNNATYMVLRRTVMHSSIYFWSFYPAHTCTLIWNGRALSSTVRECNIDDEAFDQAEETGRSIKQQPVRS
jgi:hypothetical protein